MLTRLRLRNPESRVSLAALVLAVTALTARPGAFEFQDASTVGVDVAGAWQASTYILKDGTEHLVTGQIFFTGSNWTVLFFVLDDFGLARRGSGEGGTFTLTGDQLVLTHRYHLSAGEAMPGLAASELRMVARGPDTNAPQEPCQVIRDDDRLRLNFPSGNAMTFIRAM